jgi:hypothetical protein
MLIRKPKTPAPVKFQKPTGHQEVERPFVAEGRIGFAASHLDEVPGTESEQGQRHDLQRRECRGERHVELALAGEIPVVARSDEPTAKDENDIEIDGAQRGDALHQAELVEDNRDDDGNEELEEAFDPQMNDPEPPGIGDGVVG